MTGPLPKVDRILSVVISRFLSISNALSWLCLTTIVDRFQGIFTGAIFGSFCWLTMTKNDARICKYGPKITSVNLPLGCERLSQVKGRDWTDLKTAALRDIYKDTMKCTTVELTPIRRNFTLHSEWNNTCEMKI